jgi:glycosyltransferase involved in cell wall biosynthesis
MKIGVMLRHLDQHPGGVMTYTQSLLRELIALPSEHEFVLMYQNPQHVGTHARDNVREVAIPMASKFAWDQLAARAIEKREKLDIIFNLKYSVPFLADCPTVFVCHGLDWYVMPWGSHAVDRLSHRFLIPRYARKADAIVAVSDSTRQHVVQYLGVAPDKVTRIHLGVNEDFFQPLDAATLARVRARYRLPDRFVMYVGQIYPPKNFGNLLRAYARVATALRVPLVVAGAHTWRCDRDMKLIADLGLEPWVIQTGWVDHKALHAFYMLADALVMPSLYEGCPSPLLEAMAVGCPIVTADRHGTKEVAADAGLLVDPENVDSIAEGIQRIVTEGETREKLVRAGRIRIKDFDWKQCARLTLALLERTLGRPCASSSRDSSDEQPAARRSEPALPDLDDAQPPLLRRARVGSE